MTHPTPHLAPDSLVFLPTGQRARLIRVDPASGLCHVQVLPEDQDDNDADRLVESDQLEPYDVY